MSKKLLITTPWLKRLLSAQFLLLALSCQVHAHDARPLYVEINEMAERMFTVQWKVPVSLPTFAIPEVVMPGGCNVSGERTMSKQQDAYIIQTMYRCDRGLSGQDLILHYPHNNPSLSALFRINLWNGETYNQILPPDQSTWRVPETGNFMQVTYQYTLLGIKHIFAGIDHLLFVACLVFIARTRRQILVTITGFTLAHSLTLVLSTLGFVSLPIAPVEAAIALSIIFLAHEIALDNRISWTWRFPMVVSSIFGLLHGFGFASVLLEIGLPRTERIPALLFFNLGVEIGQIIFVLILAALVSLAARLSKRRLMDLLQQRHLALVGSYAVGGMAGFWLVDRIAGF